ncbi:LacI family DNA-binding transcriptional regulator [Pelagibacterium xiamenense]|uniref:LacI family DNA-binding transcriptional regulator n=1 Tax=Pelagibacterium xiamenense TaxID=2901140 RepID=UPI001E2E236D|nr:LacI family DNA-binding transcriptional regulator [Pelagibacterium xiamenense]MCD7059854.1 LacI family DNA-binding transcriptional regulator [Pelagibacterium xiamenense]
MVGIRRLAQHLDISIGTVSRALNGRPDVNEETRKRVLEAAAELGYAPNQAGRSLRRGATSAVGFMIESNDESESNSDNFFLGVIGGLTGALAQHNLDLVVLPCSTSEDPHDYLQRIVVRRLVDAVIISATQRNDRRIPLLKKAGIPFIALGRTGGADQHAWVDLDFEGVAHKAVARLAAKGHKQIAVAVPDSDINLGHVFRNAFVDALAQNGLPFDPDFIICAKSSEHGGYTVGDTLLAMKNRPTAVVLVYEMMAIGLYRRLSEAGLVPGRDLAVVGFREGPLARFLSPALTCFRMSLLDLGTGLAEGLLATMPAFPDLYRAEPVQKLWPMELVEGESDAMEV